MPCSTERAVAATVAAEAKHAYRVTHLPDRHDAATAVEGDVRRDPARDRRHGDRGQALHSAAEPVGVRAEPHDREMQPPGARDAHRSADEDVAPGRAGRDARRRLRSVRDDPISEHGLDGPGRRVPDRTDQAYLLGHGGAELHRAGDHHPSTPVDRDRGRGALHVVEPRPHAPVVREPRIRRSVASLTGHAVHVHPVEAGLAGGHDLGVQRRGGRGLQRARRGGDQRRADVKRDRARDGRGVIGEELARGGPPERAIGPHQEGHDPARRHDCGDHQRAAAQLASQAGYEARVVPRLAVLSERLVELPSRRIPANQQCHARVPNAESETCVVYTAPERQSRSERAAFLDG